MMTNTEKKIFAAVTVFTIVVIILVGQISNKIEGAGGLHGIAVSVGKEAKSILKEINGPD